MLHKSVSTGCLTRLLGPLALAAGLVGPASAQAPFDANDVPMTGAWHADFVALDDDLRTYMADKQITALTVAIMHDGRVIYERGLGWRNYGDDASDAPGNADLQVVEENDVMRVASMTKPIVAAAIQELIHDGSMSSSARVFQYGQINPSEGLLPASTYAPPNGLGDPRHLAITVRDLIRHQGGWDIHNNASPWNGNSYDPQFSAIRIANEMNVTSPPGINETINFMLGQPLDYTPGTSSGLCAGSYCYSNFGFLLLGRIVDEVTGDDHLEYIRSEFLASWGGTERDLLHGATLRDAQHPNEPYYESGGVGANVFCSTTPSQCNVPTGCSCVEWPYGAWHHESFAGHGDLVTNTVQLLHFASRYQMFTHYAATPSEVVEIGTSLARLPDTHEDRGSHTGSIPGTAAYAGSFDNDVQYAFILNQRSGGQFLFGIRDTIVAHLEGLNDDYPSSYAAENWVDHALPTNGSGVFSSPSRSIPDALPTVQYAGRIKIKPGTTNWTGVINQAVTLDAPLGTVVIGQ